MTAREILEKQDCSGYCQGEVFGDFYYEENEIILAMQEYAKERCKELLERVAEKTNMRHTFTSAIDGKTTHFNDKLFVVENSMFTIDKDSILNVVDLEKFCF